MASRLTEHHHVHSFSVFPTASGVGHSIGLLDFDKQDFIGASILFDELNHNCRDQ